MLPLGAELPVATVVDDSDADPSPEPLHPMRANTPHEARAEESTRRARNRGLAIGQAVAAATTVRHEKGPALSLAALRSARPR